MTSIWLTVGVGIASIVVGWVGNWFFSRRTRQRPDLRSARDFDVVLEPANWQADAPISVAYDGQPVRRVSRTYLALWNRQGDTFDKSDVDPDDPLHVHVEEGDRILLARVVARSEHPAKVDVVSDGSAVSFPYLGPGDGFILEITHEGEHPASLAGHPKGGSIAAPDSCDLSLDGRERLRKPFVLRQPERLASIGVAIIASVAFTLLGISRLFPLGTMASVYAVFLLLAAVVIVVASVVALVGQWKSDVPRALVSWDAGRSSGIAIGAVSSSSKQVQSDE